MKTIACLTGSGTAPELMAEAMYALDAVARVHGFAFDQVHAPFGGVALARFGQTVPASTRDAVLGADAVLVAGAEEPTLDDVMAELDLRARFYGDWSLEIGHGTCSVAVVCGSSSPGRAGIE